MMDKESLRKECYRLFSCNTINDSYDLFDKYAECLFMIIKNDHKESINSLSDADARILLQMMLSKVLYLKSIVNGISYQSKDGTCLNKIIDPTILAQLVRNIYETTCMFNLVYRFPKSKEEKEILYLLWVCSGLNYRQRFGNNVSSEEGKKKLEEEQIQIKEIISKINQNELYKRLDEKNKKKINDKIREKDYLIKFENKEVSFLHWHELIKIAGTKDLFFDNIYTYLSFYSHPSNISVMQFKDMFGNEDKAYLQLTNSNLKLAFILLSIFIADYIYLFPNVLETFNSIDFIDQIVINYNNVLVRSDDYSINDCLKVLE